METILITGGAGFIGSNYIHYFLNKHSKYNIVNLDALSYAGNICNNSEVANIENYKFVQGDIRDSKFVNNLFEEFDINHVIHFAAESHVDNSINNPVVFVETNVLGTINLLESARKHWQVGPFNNKEGYVNSRFLHVSTDEVYGTLGKSGLFTEETPYAPNSPYSASKASSDLMVRSYFHTFGLNVVTTNCSNNYGPKQHDEKLIPTLIRNALNGNILPIYGSGENIRDWLFVEDHCKAIDVIFHEGKSGDTYLIGGKNEKTNLEIAIIICNYLDKIRSKDKSYKEQIKFVEDRYGHDFRYAIDVSKLEKELNWRAEETFETGILKTIEWYIDKYIQGGI